MSTIDAFSLELSFGTIGASWAGAKMDAGRSAPSLS